MLLLLRPRYLALCNRFRRRPGTTTSRVRDLVILLFGVAVMVGIFMGTSRALWFIAERRAFAYVPADVPLGMFFLFLFGMLLFSCAVSAFGALFLSRDLDLILASPLRRGEFFWGKYGEVVVSASWMATIFGLPAILAFGDAYGGGLAFYVGAIAAAIPFFLVPAAVAMVVVTVFTRLVPLSRTRELLVLAVAAFLYLIYQAIELFAPDHAAGGGAANIFRVIAALQGPQREWMPSYWIAQSLGRLLEPTPQPLWPLYAVAYGTLLATIALAYLVVETLHFEAFSLSRSLQRSATRNSLATHRRLTRLLGSIQPARRALIIKEYRTFARDITQTIQLLLLIGICVIYLYNFSLVRSVEDFPVDVRGWWRAFLLIMNLCMGSFVLTAACTRFVFPSVSLEGPSFWVLQTAPLTTAEILKAKFIAWFVPLAIVGVMVFSTGAWALRSSPGILLLSVAGSIAVSYGIVGLAVGLGAVFSNFEWEHASQLAASFGSLMFMFTSTILIGINVLPTVGVIFMRGSYFRDPLEWGLLAVAYVAVLVYLNVKIGDGAIRAGERAVLRKMEL